MVEVPSTVSGVVREVNVKEGEKITVGQVIFTLESGPTSPAAPPKRHAPVEHISGQQSARLSFQMAMQAEGKTEQEALPPDHPSSTLPSFTMPVQLGKVAGTEHRDPVPAAPSVRRLAREIGVDIHSVQGSGPGGRISDDDVKLHAQKHAGRSSGRRPDSCRRLRRARASRFLKVGQDRARLDARSAAEDGRASPAGVEYNSACHPAGSVPTSRNSSNCAPSLHRARKKPAAR